MPSSACDADNLLLHSFPTRRSSDLHFVPCGQLVPSCPLFLSMAAYSRKGNCTGLAKDFLLLLYQTYLQEALSFCSSQSEPSSNNTLDRKSTRLNSSHRCISYAVFCLRR